MTKHGTESGYQRHLRNGEKPCRACSAASNRACREREARRLAEEVELTGGRWVPRGGLVVWQSEGVAS